MTPIEEAKKLVFRDEVEKMRATLGYTKTQMAKHAGLSCANYSHMLHARHSSGLATRRRLAELGMDSNVALFSE